MITSEVVKSMVEKALRGAQVAVMDMTGGGDHFEILVISPEFSGKSMIQQHRMVQVPLKPALEDGRIHAVMLKTYSPEQWKKQKENQKQGNSGLLDIG